MGSKRPCPLTVEERCLGDNGGKDRERTGQQQEVLVMGVQHDLQFSVGLQLDGKSR